MNISRRHVLRLAGGGVVVAAGVGGRFVTTRRPDAALAPWDAAGQYTDARMNALSYAILSPNPHNRQPWVAELSGDSDLTIWRDKTRNLPETDPFDRQLTIGMGCFLEVLRMAAAEQGHALDIALFPRGDDGPVAEVSFQPGGTPDPLFAQVMHRHTHRGAYEDRRLSAPDIAALQPFGDVLSDPGMVSQLRDLAWEAWKVEILTPHTYRESIDLMRLGKAEVNANPDGIAMSGVFMETLILTGMLTREGQADPDSFEFKQSFKIVRPEMDATFAYATVRTPGNARLDQIEAGRRWVRMHLAATERGLVMQPISQALQEYPEQAENYAAVHQLLAEPGETVQMLGRLGYASFIEPSPRWPLETRIKNA